PAEPFYSETTAAWLTKNGHPTRPTTTTDSDAVARPAVARPAVARSAVARPAVARSAVARSAAPADTENADTQHAGTENADTENAWGTVDQTGGHDPPNKTRLRVLSPLNQVDKSDSAGSGREGAGVSRSGGNSPTRARRGRRGSRSVGAGTDDG